MEETFNYSEKTLIIERKIFFGDENMDAESESRSDEGEVFD